MSADMNPPFERSAVVVAGVAPPAGHYSHGIVAAGRILFVAGQVALDEEGNLVGRGDAAAQARQVLLNMKRVIEGAGGSMADVARTTVYLTHLEDRGPVGNVRTEFFPDPAPANTLLVVASLAHPDFLVEIDAIVPLTGGS
ncbi:MAG TPA: RidA family protein [Acidimicrobiia bacterium]|nr:RidA family protein [Acidimicrobiia bacterium]